MQISANACIVTEDGNGLHILDNVTVNMGYMRDHYRRELSHMVNAVPNSNEIEERNTVQAQPKSLDEKADEMII